MEKPSELRNRNLRTTKTELQHGGWVWYENRCFSISVDLSEKTMYDLMVAMNEDVRIGSPPSVDWPVIDQSLYDSAIVLERELQMEFEQQLKNIRLRI